MRLFLKLLFVFVIIFIAISVFQQVGFIPKRCDDLGPGYIISEDGTKMYVGVGGKHCYGIWQIGFWVRPLYL